MVKLTRDDAGDLCLRRKRVHDRPVPPQCFILLVALSEVAHHPGKALQLAVFILQCPGDGVGPESRSIFFELPAFVAGMVRECGPCQSFPAKPGATGFPWIQKRLVLADGFIGGIAEDPSRSRIPTGNSSVRIQQEQRVVSKTGCQLGLLIRPSALVGNAPVANGQDVAGGQYIPLGLILNHPGPAVLADQGEGAPMLTLLQNGLPKLAEVGIEAGLNQIVQAAVDNLGGWGSQERLDTRAGRQGFTVIVCD